MAEALTQVQLESLDDYERGVIDGMQMYAWWKNGVQYVGTTGRTYAQAVQHFLSQRGK